MKNICLQCRAVFDDSELQIEYDDLGLSASERGGLPGEAYGVCPECGSDEFEEAEQCVLCGEYEASCNMVYSISGYACPECQADILKRFEAVMEEFTPEERNLINELKDGEAI